MTGDHNDAIFRARKFRNDVVNRKAAFSRRDLKIVPLNLITLKVSKNVVLCFLVPFASERARSKGDDFFDVLHRAAGVKGRRSLG